jgi:hypothetical protein
MLIQRCQGQASRYEPGGPGVNVGAGGSGPGEEGELWLDAEVSPDSAVASGDGGLIAAGSTGVGTAGWSTGVGGATGVSVAGGTGSVLTGTGGLRDTSRVVAAGLVTAVVRPGPERT